MHQPSLDFEGVECEETNNDTTPQKEECSVTASAADNVVYLVDKVLEKEEEHKNKLYDGILSRIKHLDLS